MDRFNEVVTIQCPQCRVEVEGTLRWFYRNLACEQCGSDLTQVVHHTMNDVDEAFPWPVLEVPENNRVLF